MWGLINEKPADPASAGSFLWGSKASRIQRWSLPGSDQMSGILGFRV